MRCHDCRRHSHVQNGAGGKTNLRTDAGTEMGDCDGRLRLKRRNVSVLRGFAGDRSTAPGRCLCLGLPSPARSIARGSDEIAGEDFGSEFPSGTEARMGPATGRYHGMTGPELLASLGQLLGGKIREKIEFRGETTFTILSGDLREE